MSAPGDRPRSAGPPIGVPVAAVCVGLVSFEVSAAIARHLFGAAGVFGVVVLRLVLATAMLLAIRRPALPPAPARRLVACAGLALLVHHVAFYSAIDRLPLGVAVTLEFCGPLALVLAGRRRRLDLAVATLAAAGVACVASGSAGGHVSAVGLLAGAAAGVAWAGYVVTARRLGAIADGGGWLAWAMSLAAVASLPLLFAARSGVLHPHTLLLAVVVALLAEVVGYSLQNAALTRLDTRLFGILTSLEPATGALVGLVALGQVLSAVQWLGVALVVSASALAVATARPRPRPRPRPLSRQPPPAA